MNSRTYFHSTPLLVLLLSTSLAVAQERKPADGAPRAERQPGAERVPGRGGARSEWPAEIKLTDDQQAKVNEINTGLATKQAELSRKRESTLTEEQKAAQAAVMQKAREGNFSRQEMADQVAAALKLSPEQKTQMDAVDLEIRQLFLESNAQKTALLTDEQRATLRKLTIAGNVARTFTIPGGIAATEEQKAALEGLHVEFGAKLADLSEAQAVILTDERRAAREAAFKEARESGKDREATAAALDAALKMSDAEKTELAKTEQSLRELSQQIRDRMMALLSAEQKAELEKRFGVGRPRN